MITLKVINDNKKIIIYAEGESCNEFTKYEYEEKIKDLLLKLKKRYDFSLSGFFEAKLYENSKYGFIVELTQEQEIELFPDLIDMRLVIKSDNFLLEWSDYFLINNKNVYTANKKYYTYINDFSYDELIKYKEHYNILYGDEKLKIQGKLKRVNKVMNYLKKYILL